MNTSADNQPAAPSERTHHPPILVIEDNRELAEGLRDIFEMDGMQVHITHTGAQALALCTDQAFALALLDMKLPDISGEDLIDRMAACCPELPIIIMTGHATLDSALKAVSGANIVGYERKPLDVDRLLFLAREIMARRRAEQDVRESEEKYRCFFNTAPNLILSVNESGLIVECNSRVRGMLGYEPEELFENPVSLIVHPEDRTLFDLCVASILSGEPAFNREYRMLHKNGAAIFVSMNGTLLPMAGPGRQILCVIDDIEERKKAEDEKQKLQTQLMHSQKMEAIGTLAGGVAHDFNNMLAIINGNAQLGLAEIDPGDPGREVLEEILTAGRRAGELTLKMLTFARKEIRNVKPFCLNKLINELTSMLARSIPRKITIKTLLEPGLPSVNGDTNHIFQALLNICNNARDAMPGGGELCIETAAVRLDQDHCRMHPGAEPGGYCRVRITDTGVGMPPALVEKIFEPFFTTKGLGQGTGLGLSMTFGIVMNHKGHIDVRSTPGEGTGMDIFLPAMAGEAAIPETGSGRELPMGTETILLADDEEAFLKMAKKVLNRAGYQVLTACDGVQALEVFLENADQIALVVLDVIMPKLEGPETLARIRGLKPGIPAILASGYTADSAQNLPPEAGEAEWVQKPFDAMDLCRTVRRVLDAPRGT